jgi:hypothetical protein
MMYTSTTYPLGQAFEARMYNLGVRVEQLFLPMEETHMDGCLSGGYKTESKLNMNRHSSEPKKEAEPMFERSKIIPRFSAKSTPDLIGRRYHRPGKVLFPPRARCKW